jgi:hypothetical protein
MRTQWLALIVTLGACGAMAQDTKNTTIQAHFDIYVTRVTPDTWSGTIAHDVTIILTGRNEIREVYDRAVNNS